MKIIIPMAGMGKRMRPHTLNTPKPLIPIAGKTIVQRLVESIAEVSSEKIEEIGFVIGDFSQEIQDNLLQIAENIGAKGHIFFQTEPLGTAHAIMCAKDLLGGKVIVAFADTLFKAEFDLKEEQDGIIWVKQVDDPSAFGVVKLNENKEITSFVEKPKDFVSDLAIIGIYYFKDGGFLKSEMQYLLDNKILSGGEYQLTDALQNMMTKGSVFSCGNVDEWLDCGNKDATVYTNQRILEITKNEEFLSKTAKITNSTIIQPSFIGKNVEINNSVVGPHASIGENTIIESSIIKNSIIQTNTKIANANFSNSMIGNFVTIEDKAEGLSIGDYTKIVK